MGKLAKTLLALGLPLIIVGGCSSSSSTNVIPQPGNEAGTTDSGVVDSGSDAGMPPADGGGPPTCASICLEASGLPCYDSMRCNMNCNAAEQNCGGAAAFQPFLTCASHVTPICDPNNKINYPNCNVCAMDAGGGDAMCQAMATQACATCCGGLYPMGAASFQQILIGCECGNAGACQMACATELCAAMPKAPQPGGACDACVQGSLGADGGSGACATPVATGCSSDANCSSFLGCSSGCP